jgi:hypothetical protein
MCPSVAFNAERRSEVAEQVHAFAAAGGTWWIELADDKGGPAGVPRADARRPARGVTGRDDSTTGGEGTRPSAH